jgi:predicted Zn finger-like uncharacterized protein
MTLATTCPRCKTSFKVVSDQLKLRRGMVRCGVCQNVFNGLEHLKYVEPSASSRAAASVPRPEPEQTTPPNSPAATAAITPALENWPNVASPNVTSQNDPATPSAPAAGGFSSIEKAFGAKVPAANANASQSPATSRKPEQPQEWSPDHSVLPAALSNATAKTSPPAMAPPSRGVAQNTTTLIRQDNDLQTAFFLPDRFEAEELARSISPPRSITMMDEPPVDLKRRGKRDPSDEAVDFFSSDKSNGTTSERASRTGARIAWILLTVLALFQVVLLLRNVMVQRFPSTRYTVESISNAIGLEVKLPGNLTLLTIESFDVQATARADILAISAIIRNRAGYPIRWPAMELTLTGVDGAPVLRKIIAPADYLQPFMINNGATAQTEHPIRIGLQTNSIAPTGYSVNLFYLN